MIYDREVITKMLENFKRTSEPDMCLVFVTKTFEHGVSITRNPSEIPRFMYSLSVHQDNAYQDVEIIPRADEIEITGLHRSYSERHPIKRTVTYDEIVEVHECRPLSW